MAAWERKEGRRAAVRHANKEWGSHPQQMRTGQRVRMGRRKEMSRRSRQRGSQDTSILGHLVDSWLVSHGGDDLKGGLVPAGVCVPVRKIRYSRSEVSFHVHTRVHAGMFSLSPPFPRKTAGDKARIHSSRRQSEVQNGLSTPKAALPTTASESPHIIFSRSPPNSRLSMGDQSSGGR